MCRQTSDDLKKKKKKKSTTALFFHYTKKTNITFVLNSSVGWAVWDKKVWNKESFSKLFLFFFFYYSKSFMIDVYKDKHVS